MKKIIFIELLHHHECLENPYLIFKDKGYKTKAILGSFVFNKLQNILKYQEEFYILRQPVRSLFPRKNIFKKINYIAQEFYEIYKNTKSIIKIVHKEKPNFLYINTIESPFLIPLMLYLLKVKDIKIYLTIHNTSRIKVGFLKYFLFDFLIKLLIKKAYKIILLGEYLKFDDKNIQNKVIYFNNRIIQEKNINKFDKITFVMSGNLDCNNKDYESILKGFCLFLEGNNDFVDKVQLILLGQLNVTVGNWITQYNLSSIVKTFDHYIGEKDMAKYMGLSHYAIISTYKKSIYGKYKITGAFGDAVGFNLPIILSENYAPDYESDNIMRFKNSDFNKLLINICKGK